MYVFILLFLLLVVISVIVVFVQLIILIATGKYISVSSVFSPLKTKALLNKRDAEINLILSNFKYFRHLPEYRKTEFKKRLINFLKSKEFIGNRHDLVTFEQKVLISASAIQLTFGLRDYRLNHFSKIVVYPHSYYSSLKKEFHKGETNLMGAIVFSFEDFQLGYTYADDGINLGLHEMAHALKFDLLAAEYDELFRFYFNKYYSLANQELQGIRSGKTSLLRLYAKTNPDEFFAVCVENFFERPSQFRSEMPELFDALKKLLNQDPELSDPVSISPRKTFILKSNISSLPNKPMFSSNVISYSSSATFLLLVVIYAISIALMDTSVSYEFLPVIILFFAGILVFMVMKIKKILLYENCLVIKSLILGNFFFDIYEYSFIQFIKLDSKAKSFTIRYLDFDRIKERTIDWNGNKEKFTECMSKLKENRVSILIPKD